MLTGFRAAHTREAGFTLTELILVMMVIIVLVVIAVPNLRASRNKSHNAAMRATTDSMRTALINYAVDSAGNRFPLTDDIETWDAFHDIVNANGGALKNTLTEMGMETFTYTSDGQAFTLEIASVTGATFTVTPENITCHDSRKPGGGCPGVRGARPRPGQKGS
jgi:type II secretory pathway pseudopilin PulG